jgi:hypothetical protein
LLAPTVGDVSTATWHGRFWQMIKRSWRSLLLNRILLVLAILATAAAVVILGFLINLFIAGFSGGNDPTSVAPLAFPFALVFFVIAGIPALLVSTLLWFAYAASRTARARAHPKPNDPPSSP